MSGREYPVRPAPAKCRGCGVREVGAKEGVNLSKCAYQSARRSFMSQAVNRSGIHFE